MSSPSTRRLLNIGCGERWHPSWVNVDVAPRAASVIAADAARGLPFPDAHFDAVYHSHVIEHIRRADVPRFIGECRRVLKPQGVLRVATPDLERLSELYLQRLRAAVAGCPTAAADHEWLVVEMLDQTVREHSGGGMLEYLRREDLQNEAFILERIGQEGRELLAAIRRYRHAAPQPSTEVSLSRRVARWLRRLPGRGREALVKSWYGEDALLALRIGRFRLSGEVHCWLYDRVSLSALLAGAGFRDPVVRTAEESAIPDWHAFHLDMTPAGHVTKPDSIFMEARKSA